MKLKSKIIIISLFLIALTIVAPSVLEARQLVSDENEISNQVLAVNLFGLDRVVSGTVLESKKSPAQIVGNILQKILGWTGVLVFVMILYGGFLWGTSSGNEEKYTKAKGLIVNSVVGLVIVLSAYSIVFFVVDKLGTTVVPARPDVEIPEETFDELEDFGCCVIDSTLGIPGIRGCRDFNGDNSVAECRGWCHAKEMLSCPDDDPNCLDCEWFSEEACGDLHEYCN